MTEEFLEAFPRSRRGLILLLVSVVALAATVQFWLGPALFAHIESLPVCAQRPWWQALLIGTVGLLPVIALWSVGQARRILRSGQVPPPGTWVLRRTPIRRGAIARRRAYLLLAYAALTLAVTGYCLRLLSELPFFKPVPACIAMAASPAANRLAPH